MARAHRVLCNVIFAQKTMALQVHRLGVRVKVSCLSRLIHPSQHIKDKYPNPVTVYRLEGCITICQEVKNVSRRDQLCIVVQHESFKMNEDEYIELYAIKSYWKVTEEGESDYFLDGTAGEGETQQEIQVPLPGEVVQAAEDVNHQIKALHDVVHIDDDNEPAPENIPQPEEDADRVLGNEWGHDGFCYRRLSNLGDHHARMEIQVDATSSDYYLCLFEGLFPQQLINVVIGKVNDNIEGEPVT